MHGWVYFYSAHFPVRFSEGDFVAVVVTVEWTAHWRRHGPIIEAHKYVLDFQSVTPVRNDRGLKAIRVKS